MRLCFAFAAVWCVFTHTISNASSEELRVFVAGVGRDSCGKWLQQASVDFEVSTWILGAWSGMNYADPNNNSVGSHSDAYGIIGEVKKLCSEQPSLSISTATYQAFGKLSSKQVAR